MIRAPREKECFETSRTGTVRTRREKFTLTMATENDRAVLECIINPVLPSNEFDHDLSVSEDVEQTPESVTGMIISFCIVPVATAELIFPFC